MDIHNVYERERWGIRARVVQPWVQDKASTNPDALGQLLSSVGARNWAKQVDNQRGVSPGESVRQLHEISNRRNSIVHAADKIGRTRRADLTLEQATAMVSVLQSIAEAIEKLIAPIPAEKLPDL